MRAMYCGVSNIQISTMCDTSSIQTGAGEVENTVYAVQGSHTLCELV